MPDELPILTEEQRQTIKESLAKITKGFDGAVAYSIDANHGALHNNDRIVAYIPAKADLRFYGNAAMYVRDLLRTVEVLEAALKDYVNETGVATTALPGYEPKRDENGSDEA